MTASGFRKTFIYSSSEILLSPSESASPLEIISHNTRLAKSTSSCSRSMVETVLMASTSTPNSMFITVSEPTSMNTISKAAIIGLSLPTS